MNTTIPSTHFTGRVVNFHQRQGYGAIEVDNFEGRQRFFAHASQFVADCTCGNRHKCEISVGMTVEFDVQFDAPRNGKLPAALRIREVKA